MKTRDARAAAGRLVALERPELLPSLREAHRRRYFRELARAWDLWYDLSRDRVDERAATEAFRRLRPRLSPSTRLLDLGCGDGSVLRLASARCAEAHGADISARALERAARNCRGLGNVRLHRVAGDRLGFLDRSFDLVLCRRMLAHLDLEPVAAYLRECFRVLRPAGRLLFDLPDLRHRPYLAALVEPGGTDWPSLRRPRFWTVESARTLAEGCGFRVAAVEPGAWFTVEAQRA